MKINKEVDKRKKGQGGKEMDEAKIKKMEMERERKKSENSQQKA